MLDVTGKMIKKHYVEQDTHDFGEGGVVLICALIPELDRFGANTDSQDPVRAEPDNRAERLLKPYAAVAKEGGSLRRPQFHWWKNQWDRSRCTDMLYGDLRRKSDAAAAMPHRVTF